MKAIIGSGFAAFLLVLASALGLSMLGIVSEHDEAVLFLAAAAITIALFIVARLFARSKSKIPGLTLLLSALPVALLGLAAALTVVPHGLVLLAGGERLDVAVAETEASRDAGIVRFSGGRLITEASETEWEGQYTRKTNQLQGYEVYIATPLVPETWVKEQPVEHWIVGSGIFGPTQDEYEGRPLIDFGTLSANGGSSEGMDARTVVRANPVTARSYRAAIDASAQGHALQVSNQPQMWVLVDSPRKYAADRILEAILFLGISSVLWGLLTALLLWRVRNRKRSP